MSRGSARRPVESLVFLVLTPFGIALMLWVTAVAWRRRSSPGGWALVAFSGAELGWLTVDALALIAPTPEATVRLVQLTCYFGPLLAVSWLAFVLSYTERFSRGARRAVVALTAWGLVYGTMAVTNDAHRLVWATWEVVPDGAFSRTAYALGPLGWAQAAAAWTGVTVSLGVLLWAYAGTGARARHLSRWIVVGALAPMALNVAFLVGLGPLEKDFTPLAMGLSSAAFAIGLARYQFLDLRPIARTALVDDLREGMLVLDARGRVADVNPALDRVLGPGGAVLGRPLAETAPALARAIAEAPGDPFRLDARAPGPRGAAEPRDLEFRVSPLTDREGEPSGLLVLLHDVTQRRREQAALRRANAGLYEANAELQARNDELDAFAHTVAHDLKNSIQGVTGWAEILRDEGPGLPAAEHREIAEVVVRASSKMGAVVHELLLLAGVRQADVEPRPVAMAGVVAEAVERVRQSGVAVPEAPPVAWPEVIGHAPWVEEVWVNYLTNAAKYGGPTVTLGAEVTGAGHARFWVHDDGPGLEPEAQSRLFVPFSRVGSGEVEGHGLGLSIVRRIVERLGGTCGVESAPGRGSRFWFALPLAAEPGGRPSDAAPSAALARA